MAWVMRKLCQSLPSCLSNQIDPTDDELNFLSAYRNADEFYDTLLQWHSTGIRYNAVAVYSTILCVTLTASLATIQTIVSAEDLSIAGSINITTGALPEVRTYTSSAAKIINYVQTGVGIATALLAVVSKLGVSRFVADFDLAIEKLQVAAQPHNPAHAPVTPQTYTNYIRNPLPYQTPIKFQYPPPEDSCIELIQAWKRANTFATKGDVLNRLRLNHRAISTCNNIVAATIAVTAFSISALSTIQTALTQSSSQEQTVTAVSSTALVVGNNSRTVSILNYIQTGLGVACALIVTILGQTVAAVCKEDDDRTKKILQEHPALFP